MCGVCWNVRNAVSEDPYDHRGAMTVTVQKHPDVPETRAAIALYSFETMSLWMLQRYVTAKVDPSLSGEIFSDVSTLSNLHDKICLKGFQMEKSYHTTLL